ncbi:MAG: hypothetical protein BWY61_00484 [Firmicutes bacterium ADurb.Bin354]|nr:MAG: hypothetical protein BWY61_00484 [Firmicutes bacterium ADurb.Bin354]
MLILDKGKQLCRIGLSHKFERLNLKRSSKLSDNIQSLIGTKSLLKEFLSITDTAFRDILLCKTDLIKLIDNIFLDLGRDASCICYLKSQILDLFFLKMLKDRSTHLRSERDQKNCRLL